MRGGEAAVSGADGVAVFEALHRRRAAPDAILHAFDLASAARRAQGQAGAPCLNQRSNKPGDPIPGEADRSKTGRYHQNEKCRR